MPSSVASHATPPFYACYLLRSHAVPNSTRTYIGSTPDPRRRKRQHNGQLSQGAWKTARHRPWEMEMVVYGFQSKIAALQFEWAWQKPHLSRHLRTHPPAAFDEDEVSTFVPQPIFPNIPLSLQPRRIGSTTSTASTATPDAGVPWHGSDAAPTPSASSSRHAAAPAVSATPLPPNSPQAQLLVARALLCSEPFSTWGLRVAFFAEWMWLAWDHLAEQNQAQAHGVVGTSAMGFAGRGMRTESAAPGPLDRFLVGGTGGGPTAPGATAPCAVTGRGYHRSRPVGGPILKLGTHSRAGRRLPPPTLSPAVVCDFAGVDGERRGGAEPREGNTSSGGAGADTANGGGNDEGAGEVRGARPTTRRKPPTRTTKRSRPVESRLAGHWDESLPRKADVRSMVGNGTEEEKLARAPRPRSSGDGDARMSFDDATFAETALLSLETCLERQSVRLDDLLDLLQAEGSDARSDRAEGRARCGCCSTPIDLVDQTSYVTCPSTLVVPTGSAQPAPCRELYHVRCLADHFLAREREREEVEERGGDLAKCGETSMGRTHGCDGRDSGEASGGGFGGAVPSSVSVRPYVLPTFGDCPGCRRGADGAQGTTTLALWGDVARSVFRRREALEELLRTRTKRRRKEATAAERAQKAAATSSSSSANREGRRGRGTAKARTAATAVAVAVVAVASADEMPRSGLLGEIDLMERQLAQRKGAQRQPTSTAVQRRAMATTISARAAGDDDDDDDDCEAFTPRMMVEATDSTGAGRQGSLAMAPPTGPGPRRMGLKERALSMDPYGGSGGGSGGVVVGSSCSGGIDGRAGTTTHYIARGATQTHPLRSRDGPISASSALSALRSLDNHPEPGGGVGKASEKSGSTLSARHGFGGGLLKPASSWPSSSSPAVAPGSAKVAASGGLPAKPKPKPTASSRRSHQDAYEVGLQQRRDVAVTPPRPHSRHDVIVGVEGEGRHGARGAHASAKTSMPPPSSSSSSSTSMPLRRAPMPRVVVDLTASPGQT